MKRNTGKRLRAALAAVTLFPVLILSSCLRLPFSIIRNTPSADTPSASVETEPAATDLQSTVHTDYSYLTPFQPPEEKYTRLKDGPLPELEPSKKYGRLLPYVGEKLYGDDGYNSFNMFGLVTEDGMIVTDPVYMSVYPSGYYDYASFKYMDGLVYDIEKLTGDINKIDMNDPWNSMRHAVCAIDGSWITPFDYISVYCTDAVIFCIRDNETNDVDVFDYSGRLLYNSRELPCYGEIPPHSAYIFHIGYGEGMTAIPLTTGKTAYIDAKSGDVTLADYAQGEAFQGGYARVRTSENGLTGFINKSFDLVISPQYIYADFFYDGKCVVQRTDNSYAVIDGTGAVLFESRDVVGRWDKDCFVVTDADGNVRYYDGSFKEMTADGVPVVPLYDGWFSYTTDRGTVLLKSGERYVLDGVKQVGMVAGGLLTYYESNEDSWSEGVITLGGKTIVPLSEYISPSIVISKKTGETFVIVSTYGYDAGSESFTILTEDGRTILSGKGYATFDENSGLFQINGPDSFGYADSSGAYVFKISLLQYAPD